MSAIANDNANKAAPVESVKNGPPTPPETQASSDAKVPDLPPIANEPLKTVAAPMVPVPTGEPNKETAPAPAPAHAEKNDPPPQPEEPEAKERSADTGALPNGEATKDPPKPVSIEEVPDRELPKAHPPSPPAEAKLEEAKLDGTVEKVDDAATGDAVMTGAMQPQPEAGAEPAKEAGKSEDPVADAPKGSAADAPEGPVADAPEAAKTEPQAGDKRKADDAAVSNGDAPAEVAAETQPVAAEKKLKTDDAPAPAPAAAATTNGSPKKPGRPKKSDKPPAPAAPVGRTARKTRSQGAAE